MILPLKGKDVNYQNSKGYFSNSSSNIKKQLEKFLEVIEEPDTDSCSLVSISHRSTNIVHPKLKIVNCEDHSSITQPIIYVMFLK